MRTVFRNTGSAQKGVANNAKQAWPRIGAHEERIFRPEKGDDGSVRSRRHVHRGAIVRHQEVQAANDKSQFV